MRLAFLLVFISGWVFGIVVSEIKKHCFKKPQEKETITPTTEAFEKYWRENPNRVFVRFCNNYRFRCVVYKNTFPWFVISQNGCFDDFDKTQNFYFFDGVWNTERLSKDSKANDHIADMYLKKTALDVLANPPQTSLLDPALEKAYKELDQYVAENKYLS